MGGQGGYIRIQNKSTYDVSVTVEKRRNVDDDGMDKIQGEIPAGDQLPLEGETRFAGGTYQYIEGDKRFFLQKDGYFELVANTEGSSPSSLCLKVDRNDWWFEDHTPDVDSLIKCVADVEETEDDEFKIEVRIYNNFKGAKWMEELQDHIQDTPLCQVGLPGTHDSGTYTFDKEKGASPDSDLTMTIQDKLDKGRLLGALTDVILKNVFERLCQCQDLTIKEQLQHGIRYLDLRVACHEESGQFYTCHGVFCADMVDVMNDINEFLSENPKEIVILDFQHLYEMDDKHMEFVDSVLASLGDKVADGNEVSAQSPCSEFWDKGMQAIVLYGKREVLDEHPGVLWSRGHSIHSPWPNAGEAKELHGKLKEKAEGRNTNKFFVLQGVLTPDVELIKDQVLETGGVSIKSISRSVSPKIVGWVEEEWNEFTHNIVIVDFYEHCSILPAIINYNRK